MIILSASAQTSVVYTQSIIPQPKGLTMALVALMSVHYLSVYLVAMSTIGFNITSSKKAQDNYYSWSQNFIIPTKWLELPRVVPP